jgi:hypothetical protein
MDTVSTPLNEEMKIVVSRLRNDDGLSVQGTMNQMERMFGLKLTPTQIHNASIYMVDDFGEFIKDKSKSAQLLKFLNQTKEVIYIARYIVRSRDATGTIVGQLCQIRIPGHEVAYDRPDRYSDLCISELIDMTPEELSEVIPPVDSKRNSEDIYELYAISWVTKEAMKIAKRFPDVIMTDATSKTNSSNRPLIFVCGVDSTGRKTVWISTSLTSNESKYSFKLILTKESFDTQKLALAEDLRENLFLDPLKDNVEAQVMNLQKDIRRTVKENGLLPATAFADEVLFGNIVINCLTHY